MTPTQLEHLKLIDAHLERLLSTAEKRTPGEWRHRQGQMCSHWVSRADELSNICEVDTTSPYTSAETSQNAAFIASAAGNAEAGWRATRAAIALCIANLHTDPEFPTHEDGEICDNDGQGCRACGYTERMLLEPILAAFPLESLKIP